MRDKKELFAARGELVCLFLGCPHGDTFDACRLAEMKKLKFSEFFKWVDSLSDDEYREALLDHYGCSKARLSDY